MTGIEIPNHLREQVGCYLHKGRMARKLTLARVAYDLKRSVDWLDSVEKGQMFITDIEVAKLLKIYGGYCEDEIQKLLFGALNVQFNHPKRRLSLVKIDH